MKNKLFNQRNYDKIVKLTNPFYKIKLDLNINIYFKIYKILFNNSNIFLNDYELLLLIISSFSRISNDKRSNILILKDEIKKLNIFNYYNYSFNVLINLNKILLIYKKVLNDYNILFYSKLELNIIYDYLNNKKIDLYYFNDLFLNELSKIIINYILKTNSLNENFNWDYEEYDESEQDFNKKNIIKPNTIVKTKHINKYYFIIGDFIKFPIIDDHYYIDTPLGHGLKTHVFGDNIGDVDILELFDVTDFLNIDGIDLTNIILSDYKFDNGYGENYPEYKTYVFKDFYHLLSKDYINYLNKISNNLLIKRL